jgi:hypothetical protein
MLLKNVHWKLFGQNCLLFVHYESISHKSLYWKSFTEEEKKTSKCYVGVFFFCIKEYSSDL